MKVISQWYEHEHVWGISLLSVFYGRDFLGFVVLGICFEFPRTQLGRSLHQEVK